VIRFSLRCDGDHAFDAWFRNNDDFEAQAARRLVECPHCGSGNVPRR